MNKTYKKVNQYEQYWFIFLTVYAIIISKTIEAKSSKTIMPADWFVRVIKEYLRRIAMDDRLEDLRSKKNPKARIKILKGHFATSNSHINTYIDMSTVKVRHNNARETAKVLASAYLTSTSVDTIVCLEDTDSIGTFMAEQLADMNMLSLSKGNNISIVTPEYLSSGQMIFRDNKQRMIRNQQVLLLAASITTGKSVKKAIDTVLYYGGTVCGICSIFSSINKINGMEINTIFTSADLPDYRAYSPESCPMCKEGKRIEAIVNSFGYSKL